jgi:hypothetical protein
LIPGHHLVLKRSRGTRFASDPGMLSFHPVPGYNIGITG